MGISLGHIIIVGIVFLLFGSKKIPELGASIGQGLRAFKQGVGENEKIDPTA